MKNVTFLAKLIIVLSFSVTTSHTCSINENDDVEGIFGRNVILHCALPSRCNNIQWKNRTRASFISPSGLAVYISWNSEGTSSSLLIYRVSPYFAGSYECFCLRSDNGNSVERKICTVTLIAICQATVRLKNRVFFYNGTYMSQDESSQEVIVHAEDTINVACSEDASPETNCILASEKGTPGENTLSFTILKEHHLCYIACITQGRDGNVCKVNMTLHVSFPEMKTPNSTEPLNFNNPSSPDGFTPPFVFTTTPIVTQNKEEAISSTDEHGIFLAVIVAVITAVLTLTLVAVTFVICFYKFFSRSRSTSRSKQKIISRPASTIPIGPIYASVNRSSEELQRENGDVLSEGQGDPFGDGVFSDLNTAEKKDLPTPHMNITQAGTSITNVTDFYSEVNLSSHGDKGDVLAPWSNTAKAVKSTKTVNESDNTLYSEVNKKEKQLRQSNSFFSPKESEYNHIALKDQLCHDAEQPDTTSEKATVNAGVSNFDALYAEVRKV